MPVRNCIYALIFMIMMFIISSQHDAYNRLLIDHYAGLKYSAFTCAVMAAYNLVAALFRFIDYATEES